MVGIDPGYIAGFSRIHVEEVLPGLGCVDGQDALEEELMAVEIRAAIPRNGSVIWIGFESEIEINGPSLIGIEIDRATFGIEGRGDRGWGGDVDAAIEGLVIVGLADFA